MGVYPAFDVLFHHVEILTLTISCQYCLMCIETRKISFIEQVKKNHFKSWKNGSI